MNEIGNYRILKKLGEGGMGEVFMGEDMMLERKVAIKLLRPELSQREDILQRFRSEAVALGRLNHSNIATVYAFAHDVDRYYMAMEFVNGEPLDAVIAKRGKLAWQDAVRYTCDALTGLEHAHRLNVIHRDVKPANIMLNYTGEIKLMDFGIARILEHVRQTRSGYMIGTLEYTSPEQAQGLEVDARSDIYSMGTVLYELLTGRLPFQKNTDYELLQAQIKEMPPSPRSFVEGMPPALEDIILKALAKEPDKRFSTALEFSQALSALLQQGTSLNNPTPPQTRLVNPLSDFTKPEQSYQPDQLTETRKSQFTAVVKNYPIPAISAVLLVLAIPYFALNSGVKLPEIPTQKAAVEHKDDSNPDVDQKLSDVKTTIKNQPPGSSATLDSQISTRPQMIEYPAVSPSEGFNDRLENNRQERVEQQVNDDATNEDAQKTAQEAKRKAEKERKRREALAQKDQDKRLAQRTKTSKNESSGWVIIPGQTQKKY
ncbi:MAG: serine/threonine protein kinase [Methylobacter sp.]